MSENKVLNYFIVFLVAGMIVLGLGINTSVYYMGFNISQGWVLFGALYLVISICILIYQGLKR